MSFRAKCLLGLDADLGSSFSFNVYIIGQQDVPNYSVCVCLFDCFEIIAFVVFVVYLGR